MIVRRRPRDRLALGVDQPGRRSPAAASTRATSGSRSSSSTIASLDRRSAPARVIGTSVEPRNLFEVTAAPPRRRRVAAGDGDDEADRQRDRRDGQRDADLAGEEVGDGELAKNHG